MKNTKHSTELDRLYTKLSTAEPGTDAYMTLIEQINELEKHSRVRELKLIDTGTKIASILLVLYFERSAAVISKAFGLVRD